MSLNNLRPPKGAKHAKQARRPRPGIGPWQDGVARQQGREVAVGLPVQARIRGRPDAAPSPRAEARVPQPVPRRVRGRQSRHAGRGVRGRVVGDARAAARARARARRRRRTVKVLGRGDITKKLTVQAHKFSGSAAEKIAAAGGSAEVIAPGGKTSSCSSWHTGNYGQPQEHLRDPGTAQAGALHLRPARGLPGWRAHPDAGDQHRGADAYWRSRRRSSSLFGLYDMFSGQQPVADDGVRAGRDAVHQRVDHSAAADGRLAVPRAAVEGRRARAPEDHAVHALRHDRAEHRAGAGIAFFLENATRMAGGLPIVVRTRAGASGS